MKNYLNDDNRYRLYKYLKIMRISIFLWSLGFFQCYAAFSYGQDARVSMEMEQASVVEILKQIEQETDLHFIYKSGDLLKTETFDVDVKDKLVLEVLDDLLPEANLTYEVFDKYIAIKEATRLQYQSLQQKKTISGSVTDETGESLPGVSVVIKGTTNGTITDINGKYNISNVPADGILKFSFIGMAIQEVVVGNQMTINVQMMADAIGLEQVVVVGYGVMKKSDVVGSVASVNVNDFSNTPTSDVQNMLKGRVAGVEVTLDNAEPGGTSSILIRGKRSIEGNNDPLVIVDGVPVSSMNDINPNAIESIEILKDAASQSIYGARASNGVILITSKKGEKGKLRISYDAYVSSQKLWNNFETFDGYEFAQLKREAYRTDNGGNYIIDESIFTFEEQKTALQSGDFIDWEDEIIDDGAIKQSHSVNLSGGGEKTTYALALRYFSQDGLIADSDFNRYDFQTNITYDATKWLSIGTNVIYNRGKKKSVPGSMNTINADPIGVLYNEDGSYKTYPTGDVSFFNPLINRNETDNVSNTDKYILTLYADLKLFKGFNYRIKGSATSFYGRYGTYRTSKESSGRGVNGIAEKDTEYSDWMTLENILNYNKSFGNHTLYGTFVNSIEKTKWERTNLEGKNFPNDYLGYNGIHNARDPLSISHSANEKTLVSFMGRVQYDFAKKYYIYLTMRADASSVFSENNKWGYFPSVALSWNLANEKFVKDINAISQLKLRASYGSVGNQAISAYQSLGIAEDYNYIFYDNGTNISASGYSPDYQLANPDLKWETTKTVNVGLDFGLWRGKLSGTAEYYHSNTEDLLMRRSVGGITGYTQMLDNLGKVQNQGVELSLSGVLIDTKDLNVTLGSNFSRNRNKIKALYGDLDGDGKEDDVEGQYYINSPIDIYYDYEFDGIWQQEDNIINSHMPDASPGGIKVKDRNNNGIVDAEDRRIYDRQPDWIGSFSINSRFKNLDLFIDLYTVQGITKLNPYLYEYNKGGSLNGKVNGIKVDYWTPEDPSNKYPRPTMQSIPFMQTIAYDDASYWRIRNLTIGYTLPDKLTQKWSINKLRFYATAYNLCTWTDYLSFSPEKDPDGYPESKDFLFGIQVQF
ncbi:TonB-dependent receptor [Labilibacter sediminis]|nr:TonB-dependent receptor [Labilibacter sediminis]